MLQSHVEIVDAEEEQEPLARRRLVRTDQGRMLVRAPLVEAEQDGAIRIQDLAKVVMARTRFGLAKQRLVPLETARHVAYADDCPGTFHRMSAAGLSANLLVRCSGHESRIAQRKAGSLGGSRIPPAIEDR